MHVARLRETGRVEDRSNEEKEKEKEARVVSA